MRIITLTTSYGDLEHGGSTTTTVHTSLESAYATLRENFDELGEYDNVPNSELQRELLDDQGVFSDITEHDIAD